MKKSYYLFNPGILSRKDNTLKFTPVNEDDEEGQPKYIPVEAVNNLFVFGSLRVNSALLNFLGKQQINVHFFDYYEHYTGSFMAKEYLLAGSMQIKQTEHYLNPIKRQRIAKQLIIGASANMLRNLKYYQGRERDVQANIDAIENWIPKIAKSEEISELMGIEGNIRQLYYQAFDSIITEYKMGSRQRQPPNNEVNTLISFGNMLCYTICLDQIYHTQLNPTISFLHEPGTRRYSLALDLAEIFKPILVDRLIFKVLNKRILKPNDFDVKMNACRMKEKAQKTYLQHWNNRLDETIKHRSLGRNVSYKHLIRLECYKLAKHLMGITPYEPFKAWW